MVAFVSDALEPLVQKDSRALVITGNYWVSPAQAGMFSFMEPPFAPGDDLIFQLESGFGLLRVIAIDQNPDNLVWHLTAYEELFPDVESAEAALKRPEELHLRKPHMALTDRAFVRTPAARLDNRPVTADERARYENWAKQNGEVSDRSALLMLGLR